MNNYFIIVIAGRNNSKWVEANLGSVISQTYSNYEVMFFDDASDDDTFEKALEIVKNDSRFKMYKTEERKFKTWFFANYLENFWDNQILVFLDGDDFFHSENVLEYLNEVYNQTGCWMTYGGMRVWDGIADEPVEPYPQNSEIPPQVHQARAYRKDTWRSSHLKTMRGFVWNALDRYGDLIPNGTPMVGPDDLAIMFGALELCPPNKVYRVTDPLYVYNHAEANHYSRAFTDHKATKIDYEGMVRNRKPYDPISFVMPTLAGGLGNQMFEIAAAASLAKDNNAVLIVNPDEHILPNQGRNVNNYRDNIFSRIIFDNFLQPTNFYKRDLCTYEPIPYRPNLKIAGHFQSYKYFDHNRDYIKKLFSPSQREWQTHDAVAVQVRRGDYYKFPDHHPQLLPEYFMTAVKLTNAKQVMVFTDDVDWCHENLDFGLPVSYGGPDKEDWFSLLCMTCYKDLVISNSSFGWWAAYLNHHPHKKIYVPSTWFGRAMIAEGFNIDDLVLPEWIKVQV